MVPCFEANALSNLKYELKEVFSSNIVKKETYKFAKE